MTCCIVIGEIRPNIDQLQTKIIDHQVSGIPDEVCHMKPAKTWGAVLFVCALGLAAGLQPYETIVIPAWRIRVVDEYGEAYRGMAVTQAWKHYTLETEAGQNLDTHVTNDSGYVEFPERRIKASFIRRLFLTVFSGVMTLAHGGFGVHAYIYASGPPGYSEAKYVVGKPLPSQLVLTSDEQ